MRLVQKSLELGDDSNGSAYSMKYSIFDLWPALMIVGFIGFILYPDFKSIPDPEIILSEPQKITSECVVYAVNGNRSFNNRIYLTNKYKLSSKQKIAAQTCISGRNRDYSTGNRYARLDPYPIEKCKNSSKTKNKQICASLALGERIFISAVNQNINIKNSSDLKMKNIVEDNKHLYSSNQGSMFKGVECTDDCSGHEAGYNWAEDNYIDDLIDCENHSTSFQEGCEIYVLE